MENREIIEKLSSLMKLDFDAAKAYESAMERVDDPIIKGKIQMYQDDHLRHVDMLSEHIRRLGGIPPERSTGLKGLFLSGTAAIQGLTGTGGALKALQAGEKITNKSYNDAVHQDFPVNVKVMLEANFRDEQKHLEYINMTLENKSWKE